MVWLFKVCDTNIDGWLPINQDSLVYIFTWIKTNWGQFSFVFVHHRHENCLFLAAPHPHSVLWHGAVFLSILLQTAIVTKYFQPCKKHPLYVEESISSIPQIPSCSLLLTPPLRCKSSSFGCHTEASPSSAYAFLRCSLGVLNLGL